MTRFKRKGVRRRGEAYYFRSTEYVREGRGKRRQEHWTRLGSVRDEESVLRERLEKVKAEARLQGAEKTLRRGPKDSVLVGEAAQVWLRYRIGRKRNERGQRLAGRRVVLYLTRYLGDVAVGAVTSVNLEAYKLWLSDKVEGPDGMVGRTLSVQTVRHVLADARCFFRWCVASGYLRKSPVPEDWLPTVQEQPPERLKDAEVDALLAIEEPYRFVIRFGLVTGLRWGEMVRAKTTDVSNGMLVVTETKSGRMRSVPIPPGLFEGREGRVMPFSDPTSFARTVRKLSHLDGKEGRRWFHPHQLRHTFASRWVERGGSLTVLREILGHSEFALTLRYARMNGSSVREEYARVMV